MNNKTNFMKLSKEFSDEKSKFLIVTVPYEGNTSFGKGAINGPKEIINASEQLDYYDLLLDSNQYEKGIITDRTLEDKKLVKENLKEEIIKILNKHKKQIPIFIGGDHSITIHSVRALCEVKQDRDFGVVIFDAHADFWYSLNGEQLNHANVTRNLSVDFKTKVFGVRTIDFDEKEAIEKSENASCTPHHTLTIENFKEELNKLPKKIYFSIDVDAFNPELISMTGTPEPSGFKWDEMIDYLKILTNEKEIIGFDVCEFSPDENNQNRTQKEAYFLAKLIYHLIGMIK